MGSQRLGCLYIPDFRIQVHRQREGLDPQRPLVLLESRGRRQLVTATSAGAETAGVRVGMSLTQAETACPEALFRQEKSELSAQVSHSLLERLLGLTPVVEAARLGLFYLGMRGLRWLHRDEAALLDTARQEARREQLEATASAAGTRFTALIAARIAPPGGIHQVPACQDAAFLAPLPLSYLAASRELHERLRLAGLETLGELAQLSPRAIERRYGKEGVELYRLAKAEDDAHLQPTVLPTERTRTLLLEEPILQAQGLLFLLAPLLEQLLEELTREGRACGALTATLRLADGQVLEVPVLLGAPVTQSRPLLDLLRLKLTHLELPEGVLEVRLEATRVTEPTTPQGDLFRRVGSPSGMAMTLARLTEALGADAVVQSQSVDAYRPDHAYVLRPVQEGAPELLKAEASAGASARSKRAAASSPPPASPLLSLPAQLPAGSGFRQMRPPMPLRVQEDEQGPGALFVGGRRRQVLQRHGPFRYEGRWWEQGYGRDYYQLQLSDQAEVLIFREVEGGAWFLEGVYD